MSKQTSVYLPDGLATMVDAIVRESAATEDVPALSQSDAIRHLLRAGFDAVADGTTDVGVDVDGDGADEVGPDAVRSLLPEHEVVLHRRDEFRDGEAQLRNLRTGFEARVRDHFKTRFESGTTPEQLREWAANMRMDARILWPEPEDPDADDPHADRRAEALSFVDKMLDATIDSVESSDVDPLDPDAVYARYQGVERGERRERARDELRDDLVDDAVRMLDPTDASRSTVDESTAIDALAARSDVDRDLATDVVETAADRLSGAGGRP
jgi:hypothetical protein